MQQSTGDSGIGRDYHLLRALGQGTILPSTSAGEPSAPPNSCGDASQLLALASSHATQHYTPYGTVSSNSSGSGGLHLQVR